jgi:hypothetical protein
MAVHGRHTYISLDADDLSTFANSTTFNRTADSHDTTTYTKNSHTYQGGLKDGTVTIGGFYETGPTGPAAVIEPLLGTTVPFVYRPEGTGAGLPQKAVDVVVTSYNQSAPVADMIQWTAELQMTDDVDITAQAV